jgi:hypothetical protein
LLVVALVSAWLARLPSPTASSSGNSSARAARFTLDRIGLHNQQISNVAIGDPKNPTLVVACRAHPDAEGTAP